jgi:hypothetical protein
MNTPSHVWEKLSSEVEPSTVADGEIETISVSFKEGGMTATTVEPIPDINTSSEDGFPSAENIDEIPENESVFIFDDYALELKERILENYHSKFENSDLLEYEIVNINVTKDTITAVCRFSISLVEDEAEELYGELADALVENGEINNSDEFAFGTIDKAHYTGDEFIEKGWEFDGTVYQYTDEPYNWWAEPDNIEEWAEFVSDTEIGRQQELNRDEYVVHLHPSEYGLDESNSYIEWWKDAKESLRERVNCTEKLYLTKVSVDSSRAKLWGSVKL